MYQQGAEEGFSPLHPDGQQEAEEGACATHEELLGAEEGACAIQSEEADVEPKRQIKFPVRCAAGISLVVGLLVMFAVMVGKSPEHDLEAHRANVQRFIELTADTSNTDTYASKMNAEIKTTRKGKFKTDMAMGIANTAKVAINGGSGQEVGEASYNSAISIVGGVAGMVNPMLGLAVTMAMTMMQGIFFQTSSNPTKELFDSVMSAVGDLIKQNNLNQQMASVKNSILGITEELSWVPELVDTATDDVMTSYYLTVQHDLATGVRSAFGECYDDLGSGKCKSWQEAGTVEISLDYAQLHLEVFNSIYALDSSNDEFRSLLQTKMTSVGTKYKCLLLKSYEAYKATRNHGGRFEINKKTKEKNKRSCSSGKNCVKCTWEVKVKDKFLNQWVKSKSGTGKRSDEKDCKKSAKNWGGRKKTEYLDALNSDLKAQYEDPINALFSFLTGADASDPCASSGMTTR